MKKTISSQHSHLHDGFLDGVVVDRAIKRATLYFTTTTGERVTLTMTGLQEMVLNDFREGNIVLDAAIVELDDGYQVRVTPSYGAELTASCKDLEWTPQ